MPTNTPDQQITLPDGPDAADNPVAFVNSVADIEPRLVRKYANSADRTARMVSLSPLDFSTLSAEGRAEIYDGANHLSLYQRSMFGIPVKPADQTLTPSSTALQNVTGLVQAMPAAGAFAFRGVVFYESSTVADIKFAFTGPAGSVFRWGGLGVVTGGGSTGDGNFVTVVGNDVTLSFGGAGTGVAAILVCRIEGFYLAGGTAGNFQFRAAQNTSEASNTIVSFGSRLEIWRYA